MTLMNMDKDTIQITVVGDGTVGKTSMLLAFTTNEDLSKRDYVPTIFDTNVSEVKVDKQTYKIQLWDTAGQEGYERLRPLSYTLTSCFLVCFAVDSKTSYDNVLNVWIPEVRHFKPKIPIILVGTKIDTRNGGCEILTNTDGEKLKVRIKSYAYLECSAMTREGIREVFKTAVRSTLDTNKKTPKQASWRLCRIL